MSNFLQDKNNRLSNKQNKKEQKKQLNKALHQVFGMAMEGQIASLNHMGQQYVMLRNDKLNELIQNGGRMNATPQQKEFNASYQQLLQFMQTLDTSDVDSDENRAFEALDGLTFDFSEARFKRDQEDAVNEFKKVLEEFPFLTDSKVKSGKLT